MPTLPSDYAYIGDDQFDALVESLLHPEPSLDPRGQIVTLLVEAGLAPVNCLYANLEDEAA